MSARDLLARLEACDIRIAVEGEKLTVDGPAGSLTTELRAELADHKLEMLAQLRRQQSPGTLEARTRFARFD